LNRGFVVDLDGRDFDMRLESSLSVFKDKGVPVNWILRVSSRSYDIGEKLKDLGMKYKNGWSGMALRFKDYKRDTSIASGVEVVKVKDRESLKTWSDIVSSSFSVPDDQRNDYLRAFTSLGYGAGKPWDYYIGIMNGTPSSSCMVYMESGTAGLYWVGTLPDARGKGLATAVVCRALDDALLKVCHTSILQASAAGKPVYERLGFKEYCKFDIYTWAP
jgi:GNAT superfamily N-acetyltransferase